METNKTKHNRSERSKKTNSFMVKFEMITRGNGVYYDLQTFTLTLK